MPSSTKHTSTQQLCRWYSYSSVIELEHAVLQEILKCAQIAIRSRGAFHIVLAGGTTPRKIYEQLRIADTDWSAWHIYFGDERCLPPNHDERNSRMAELALLDHVAIPLQQIHPIPAEKGAEKAESLYDETLKSIELFDLVLLGLGEDGHTASLFPVHEWGASTDAPAVLAVHNAPKPPPDRVSLSAHRLAAARQVLFIVTGDTKRQAVKNWQSGADIPAASITPSNGVDIYLEAGLL